MSGPPCRVPLCLFSLSEMRTGGWKRNGGRGISRRIEPSDKQIELEAAEAGIHQHNIEQGKIANKKKEIVIEAIIYSTPIIPNAADYYSLLSKQF